MPTTIGDLLLLTGVIAAGFLFAVAFYESLSTRDVLVARAMRTARGFSERRWFVGGVYVATVGVGIPILVVLWTVVLEAALVFVGSDERIDIVALIAVSVVGAVRILSYVRQKTAHELAKAIPLSFAFILLTGGSVDLLERLTLVSERPQGTELTSEMLWFLIALELGLRFLTDGSHAILATMRRRRGVASDLDVWRTLMAAVRRPIAPLPLDHPPR